MAAPAIKIDGGAAGAKAAIAANTEFSATLDSTAGVRTVEWSILSTDETSETTDYTLVTSGSVGQTVTLTSLGEGTVAILHVKINGGYNALGQRDPTTTEATAKFGVLLSSGLWVGAANEKLEHDPTYGSTALLNAGIRLADTLDVGQYDAQYLVRTASAILTDETAIDAITSTVEFASTSTIPFATKRTSSTTNGFVTAGQSTALSSGTALTGFGPAWTFLGEVSGGGAENYGLVGFAATDLTGGSEDTKFVAQARTAGAALATVFEASGTSAKLPGIATGSSGLVAIAADGTLSRTASGSGLDANAHVLEDATTALGANGVPMRAAPATVGFVGVACAPTTHTHKAASAGSVVEALGVGQTITGGGGVASGGEGVHIAWRLPNGFGALTVVGTERVEYTSVLGATVSAKRVWATIEGGSLVDRMTLSALGVLSAPAGLLSASLDAASAGALTLGGTNATSIAGSGLPFTGVLSVDNSGGTLDLGANTTGQSVGKSGTTWAIRGAATVASTLGVGDAATITKSGNAATTVAGLTLQNTTATSGGTTEQRAPVLLWKGQGRDTSGGGSNQEVDVVFVPTLTAAAGGPTIELRPQYQRAGGGFSNFGGYWTTSAAGYGGLAFTVGTIVIDTTGNGVRFATDGNGGLKKDSTDVMVTSGGSNAVGFATNSTWRHKITSTGAVTKSKDTSAVERTQHGTAGVNYKDRTGLATTVTASATSTLYTISTVSNSYVKVEVDATAYDTTGVGSCRIFGKRRPFKNIAGTITDGTANDIHADDDLGTAWGTPPSLAITSSGTDILIRGTACSNDTKFIIHEIRVYAGTTSA